MGHPAVAEAAVVGDPRRASGASGRWRRSSCATAARSTVEELREFLAEKVAHWQLPERVGLHRRGPEDVRRQVRQEGAASALRARRHSKSSAPGSVRSTRRWVAAERNLGWPTTCPMTGPPTVRDGGGAGWHDCSPCSRWRRAPTASTGSSRRRPGRTRPRPSRSSAELRQLDGQRRRGRRAPRGAATGRLAGEGRAAVREARADRAAAVARLRRERADGATIRADSAVGAALEAEGEYLELVGAGARAPADAPGVRAAAARRARPAGLRGPARAGRPSADRAGGTGACAPSRERLAGRGGAYADPDRRPGRRA